MLYWMAASKLAEEQGNFLELDPIHHSAAHFDSEGQVCAQAAALFERTRSRSLVVAGASRYAVKGDHRSECQRQFQIADAAHNSRTMFHWVNTVLKDLAEEDVRTGGIEDDHFFVQWHGMSETSCVASDVFISTGIANNSVYDKNIPANKLMLSFNRLAVDLRLEAKTPRQDVQCKLTAGTNVFGRYVNGVPGESVCNTTAQEKDVIGRFVHVEQKAASRDNISLWTSVIEDAFPVAHASQPIAATILTALGLLCTLLF
ncbi:hypothetical protein Y032_0632g883 [Ancylostoma ceylanicum]|nr:hypothetical protein Y032_0632g883 [Ancylostoma ceylanicum]